jgi:hypothetical protein
MIDFFLALLSGCACSSDRANAVHYTANGLTKGDGNVLLFPTPDQPLVDGPAHCNARLGGLLRDYSRAA